jgi:hypothetical protein
MQRYRVSLLQIFAIAGFYSITAPAVAADSTSAIGDAHQVLKQLINKGYVAGNPEKNRHYNIYRGYRCHSTMEIRHEDIDIDWDRMTAVTDFAEFAHAHGPVTRTDVNGLRSTEKDAGFWLPDADTARQLADAMRVLLNSCAPKPKSD